MMEKDKEEPDLGLQAPKRKKGKEIIHEDLLQIRGTLNSKICSDLP
jgi:hypothetical protein